MKSFQTGMDVLGMAICGKIPEWAAMPLRYISLHTAAPIGDQTSNELTFEGYARIRTLCGAWVQTPTGVSNADVLLGPVCFEECDTLVTHVAIGLEYAGPGQILYAGRLKSPVKILFNRRVAFEAGALTFIET